MSVVNGADDSRHGDLGSWERDGCGALGGAATRAISAVVLPCVPGHSRSGSVEAGGIDIQAASIHGHIGGEPQLGRASVFVLKRLRAVWALVDQVKRFQIGVMRSVPAQHTTVSVVGLVAVRLALPVLAGNELYRQSYGLSER